MISFPGAEGHGRYTTGGRGGKVYHVTSLEDDGSQGTLRWALKQNGPKTIVFDVAGTIHLKSELRTGKDHLTIAGQTSPGGICLADYGFSINSNNVIIRFLRFRPGEASGKEPDGLGGCDKKDIMVDHCSVSWSVDECLSVYGMENSTVQWCIGSEALRKATHVKGAHGYGGNWGGHKASYHHNLIAHCESRVPRLGPRPSTLALGECVDIRNNVSTTGLETAAMAGKISMSISSITIINRDRQQNRLPNRCNIVLPKSEFIRKLMFTLMENPKRTWLFNLTCRNGELSILMEIR